MDVINRSLIDISKNIENIINGDKKLTKNFIEILDIFLETSNDILLDNMLDMLLPVRLLKISEQLSLTNIEFLSKTISYQNNIVKFQNMLGEGGYGFVTHCVFNGLEAVMKNPQYKNIIKIHYSESVEINKLNEVNRKFLKENMIHFILFCFHEKFVKCLNKKLYNCVPRIYNIIKSKTLLNNIPIVCTIMEKLDYDVKTFFDKEHSFQEELKLIAMLSYNLYILQTCFKNFIHGDLHSKNVMLQKLPSSQIFDIETDKVNLKIESNYKTFLIDFGFASANFDSLRCKNINMLDAKIFANDNYHRLNKGQDMRLFLASILYWNDYKTVSKELKKWLKHIFKRYQTPEFLQLKKRHHPTYYFYDEVSNIDDSNFYPENILLFVKSKI